MSQVPAFRRHSVMLACAALFFGGCGSNNNGVKLEGKVVKDGKPFQPTSDEILNLSFHALSSDGDVTAVYPARLNESDGSFVLYGPKGNRLPPGKYRINMNLSPKDMPLAAKTNISNRQLAQIDGKEYEVTSEPEQVITIEITTGTVTR
jgi:hypothetical protein